MPPKICNPGSISQPFQSTGVFAPVFLKAHCQIKINPRLEQCFQLKPGGTPNVFDHLPATAYEDAFLGFGFNVDSGPNFYISLRSLFHFQTTLNTLVHLLFNQSIKL